MIKKIKVLLIFIFFFCFFCLYVLIKPEIILESEKESSQKVILLGVDAAEWSVINPLIEEGKLPNFKKIKQEGSYGHLISPYAFSPISWTEIATGKTKEKHGIYDFFNENKTGFITSNDVKSKRIWNILNEHGKTTGIYHWLTTWPANEINGFMVSDWLEQNAENNTYPEEISEELKRKGLNSNNTIKEVSSEMSYLLEKYKPDFFAGVDYDIHQLEHYLWKYWEPQKFNLTDQESEKHREFLVDSYKDFDNFLGKLGTTFGKETIIFIISDHGMKAQIPVEYYINFLEFLKELNLLNYVPENPDFVLSGSRLTQVSQNIVDEANNSEYIVNFLFLNKTANKTEILETLLKVKFEGTNQSFFSSYTFVDENIVKFTIDGKLLKINLQEDTSKQIPNTFVSLFLPNGYILKLYVYEKSGEHPPGTNGVIIVKGPMIKQNYEIINATTYDITPTILYLYGIPIPNDMDGGVLTEIIKDDFLKKHPIQYLNITLPKQEKINETLKINQTMAKEIEEKLRELGYIN